MAYTTVDAVRLVLSSVDSEYGGTAADLSNEQIQFEIDGATAEIDAKLQTRYLVPFEPETPKLIKTIATDIAAYRSDLNYRKSREYDGKEMPIIMRYNDAQRLLEAIRVGKARLVWPRADSDDYGALVVNPGEGPVMTQYNVYELYPRW